MPAKQTTRHVKKPQLPEGGINRRGFMKIRDKQTGRIKYIDAKIGIALDNSGDPTHERF